MKIKIVLADDHKVMRDGLKALLEQQADFQVLAVASDGQETVQLAKELQPDIVIMDINMPNMTGIEATRQIKQLSLDLKVLTLSVHNDSELIAQMIHAGASGYLPKNCAADELILAIRKVMANEMYLSPQVVNSVFQFMQKDPAQREPISTILTSREREVLQLIAEGKSTKEISVELFISERTVDSHRQNIMQKTGIRSIAELTKYAIRQGLTPLE